MFVETLLSWYQANRRDLPWRNVSDPYLIWVSEIILQQTRVAQGHDYYLRFVRAFPDVQTLAEASEDEVLRLWQGLGYYSRARNMLAAARQIVHAGGFPRSYDGVRKLKGVGPYTAAAVCSFAYGLPCAVVDGNVYRVLSRYFGIDIPTDTTCGKKTFADLAQQLLPAGRAADYNQALMDFGAMQCVPAAPRCGECPLAAGCLALKEDRVGSLPVKSRKPKVTERFFVYIRVSTPEGVWLHRRTGNDIWRGLYEFPLVEFPRAVPFRKLCRHEWVSRLPQGGTWKPVRRGLKHVLTHRIIHADLYTLTYARPVPLPPGFVCVREEDLDGYALPKLLAERSFARNKE